MTFRTSSPRADHASRRAVSSRRRGFTLLELILVMALLSIAMGVSFPTLREFFRGRALDNEARRLLALTQYGQNRAASEGAPMVLWIDEREGAYGLAMAAGYLDDDPKALEYRLGEDLELRVEYNAARARGSAVNSGSVVVPPWTATHPTAERRPSGIRRGLAMIRLLPDGFIDRSSPWYVEIREGDKDTLWLVQTTNRLAYELRAEQPTVHELRDVR